jgi:hypothetical protein
MLGPVELHAGCVASVRRLTHSGQYATYQNVVQSVLQSYNVYRFQDIGVGDPSQIPCLKYLWQVQRKVEHALQYCALFFKF